MAHMETLDAVGSVHIKEQVSIIEAITAIIGQEIEMANKYKVEDEQGHQIFFAVEETDCCKRQMKQCAPDCAPWNVAVLHTANGQESKAFHLERDFTCTCCCFNRPTVTVTDVTTGEKIGSIVDPWACCDLTFTVRDGDDNEVMKANGGCCQMGLFCPLPCGPCAEVNFPVTDAVSGAEIGKLQKKVPGCMKWCCAPDVDNFDVQFGDGQSAPHKALLIALAIFMDFRYFNENPNDDEGGVVGAMG